MRIYARKELKWKNYDLFLKDRRVIAIYEKDDNPELFYVEWNDEVRSADYYNKPRAKEHAMLMALRELNNEVEEEE